MVQTNFILHVMQQAVSIPKGPDDCGMVQMAGSSYGIKNKEQGSRIEPRVGLSFGGWLTEETVFLVKRSIHSDTKVL